MVKDSRIYQNSILPGQRIVYGPFGEVGYILKNPDYTAIASKRTQEKRYNNRERLLKVFKDAKALKSEAFNKNYHERLDIIKLRSAAQRVVDLGMKEAENELEQKRNKLRKSLLEDESKYIAEYTDKAQKSLDRRLESESKRAEEITTNNKISDTIYTQKAYERLAMEKDEEFREELRLKSSKNVVECIKAQICEKEYRKIQDENDDRIWNGMYEERLRVERLKIENANVAQLQKRQEWVEILDKQIEAGERLKNNKKCLEKLDEIRMKEYTDSRAAEYEMRDRILKDRLVFQAQILKQQIAENRRISERNKQEEIDIDRILIEDVRRKVQREEAAKVDNRNQLRAELSSFKEATVQYRSAQAEEDAIMQRMIEKDRIRIDRKLFLERKKREIEQRNFAYLCAQRSKQMVSEKAARDAEEKKMDAKQNQLLNYRNEINEQLGRGRRLYNPMFQSPITEALQNKHNEQYLEILRQRQRLEDFEMLEKMRHSQNEMHSKIREAMAKPLQEIVGTSLHPFYTYIKSAKNS